MNMHANAVSTVQPPPAPRKIEEVGLNMVMMRDILIKTMFRTNQTLPSELARLVALPVSILQQLVDIARAQKLLEATGQIVGEIGRAHV